MMQRRDNWRRLLAGMCTIALLACADKGSSETDADGDGVPASEDCDDNDPSLGARDNDNDCDGVVFADDCDDVDPFSPDRSEDADCDGYPTDLDCNDADDSMPAIDADCDGVTSTSDCDDDDPDLPALDADCDGVLTTDDCDDTTEALGDRASDADCDGAASAVDCDDADAALGDITQDADCDGVRTTEDCDDGDADKPALDADCDGVATADDCSDFDAALGAISEDVDCDGVPNDYDCAPTDVSNSRDTRTDYDCDGVLAIDDCDDHDPVMPRPDDFDCDDVPTHAGGGDLLRVSAGTWYLFSGTESVHRESSWYDIEVGLVTLTGDVYMGETEVTRNEFSAVMGYFPEPDDWCNDDCPVNNVTFGEIAEFLNTLSIEAGFETCYTCDSSGSSCTVTKSPYECEGYRLPTEAEWDRAATCGQGYLYSGSDDWQDVAHLHNGSHASTMQMAAQLDANDCGLYDMSGNINEMVNDFFSEDHLPFDDRTDPLGPSWEGTHGLGGSAEQVIRGGGADTLYAIGAVLGLERDPDDHASSYGDMFVGFRVARTAP